MNIIDNFLNSITMYRLVLYYLILLLCAAVFLSLLNYLPFDPIHLFYSTIFLLTVCYITNKLFAYAFNAPTNLESIYITALILALIITPLNSVQDLPFLFWAGVWASASKFIFAINKKHMFNPAAFAVALTALTISSSASWWVGTASMFPFVLLGILIVRKIRRFDLVLYFFITAIVTILAFSIYKGSDILVVIEKTFLDTPLLFFAFVMLTEPLTSPPTKILQSIFGSLVGFLFVPQLHFGNFAATPEIALLIGNVYSYIVSPKEKLILKLKEKIKLGPDIFDFVFALPQNISYSPGQYMEWTLSHKDPDSRGVRRFFTLASSPTENTLRLGVKFYEKPSTFKKTLSELNSETEIVASQLSGDFTLPKDPNKKLVFIAGGIGVTPFRSIIKYLLDTKQKRDIVLFYSNKTVDEAVYHELFDEAAKQYGLKTIYVLSDLEKIPANWLGGRGIITKEMIISQVPDFKDRIFYLSGPHGMVAAFEKTLREIGVPRSQVETDYFPGFA